MKKRDFLKSLLTLIPASIIGEKVIAEIVVNENEGKSVKEINIDENIPSWGPPASSGMCYLTDWGFYIDRPYIIQPISELNRTQNKKKFKRNDRRR